LEEGKATWRGEEEGKGKVAFGFLVRGFFSILYYVLIKIVNN